MPEAPIHASGRVIVLECSLTGELPEHWNDRLLSRRAHRLGGLDDVTVLEYSVRPEDEGQTALELAARLSAPGYYAHMLRGDSMTVVFPKTVFLLRRDDPEMIERCRAYGRTLAIPDSQMQFERMFDFDHPDQIERGG